MIEETGFQMERGNTARDNDDENKKATATTRSDTIRIVLVINLGEAIAMKR